VIDFHSGTQLFPFETFPPPSPFGFVASRQRVSHLPSGAGFERRGLEQNKT